MLSRHFFREKVLQTLYAYTISENSDLVVVEKNMLSAIDRLYDLYIYQLSVVPELIDTVNRLLEDASQKYFPEESERVANEKFVNNRISTALISNGDFKKKRERLKINWAGERDIFKTIYNSFKTKEIYKTYLQKEEHSFEDDRQILSELFKYAINYPALVDKFIEKNLYWEDDFFQIAQLSYNTLRSIEDSFDEYAALPEFFDGNEDGKSNEDRRFMIDLLRKAVLHDEKLTEMIKKRISKWEYERIAVMDIILVKMAIVEFLYFPSIPVKVTINEYIELSKEFSTEKSKTFVNAILDKVVVDLKEDGLLKKAGRGLING